VAGGSLVAVIGLLVFSNSAKIAPIFLINGKALVLRSSVQLSVISCQFLLSTLYFPFFILHSSFANRVSTRLLVIPLLWSLIGSTAALVLGVTEDFGLFVAGVLGMAILAVGQRSFSLR
jgi:hypothetical protein